jgi:hypothetical protein
MCSEGVSSSLFRFSVRYHIHIPDRGIPHTTTPAACFFIEEVKESTKGQLVEVMPTYRRTYSIDLHCRIFYFSFYEEILPDQKNKY